MKVAYCTISKQNDDNNGAVPFQQMNQQFSAKSNKPY